MALTKTDISQISKLFNQGFEKIILPTLNSMGSQLASVESRLDGVESRLDGVESRLGNLESDVRIFRDDLAGYVKDANDKFEINADNIGFYFEKCATKEEYGDLKKRVRKLELTRA